MVIAVAFVFGALSETLFSISILATEQAVAHHRQNPRAESGYRAKILAPKSLVFSTKRET